MPNVAYVALGSNLGDRDAHLAHARRAIGGLPDTRILAASAVEETEPLGGMQQPPYLNQMLAVETGLTPHQLLEALQRIEQERGRTREARWASRTLDLDIVGIDGMTSSDPALRVPHPGVASRDFWRRGLAALARTLGR
jgi:2-amino-4-hydroxy-6-hydroxymethyldihydropteridine diphosphokinase